MGIVKAYRSKAFEAIDETIKAILWFRGFLEELGYPQNQPTVIFTDSESAVTILTTKYYPTITRAQILADHLNASSAGSLKIEEINQVRNFCSKLNRFF